MGVEDDVRASVSAFSLSGQMIDDDDDDESRSD